jgi:hypothetical protein
VGMSKRILANFHAVGNLSDFVREKHAFLAPPLLSWRMALPTSRNPQTSPEAPATPFASPSTPTSVSHGSTRWRTGTRTRCSAGATIQGLGHLWRGGRRGHREEMQRVRQVVRIPFLLCGRPSPASRAVGVRERDEVVDGEISGQRYRLAGINPVTGVHDAVANVAEEDGNHLSSISTSARVS